MQQKQICDELLEIAVKALEEIKDTDCKEGYSEESPLPAWVTADNALLEIERVRYTNGVKK